MNAGTLFLIVGPSGVGKDSLIDGVKARFANDAGFVFPARFITRPQSAGGEAHIEVSSQEFQAFEARGEFALSWQAHGLHYGVPASIRARLKQGDHVLVNVSRAILDQARAMFSNLVVVSVSASRATLEARLRARRRETTLEIDDRVARASAYNIEGLDVIHLENNGALEVATDRLEAILRGNVSQ